MTNTNGKGDKPRNCFSNRYRDNFDAIEWRPKGSFCYVCKRKFRKDEARIEDEKGVRCSGGCMLIDLVCRDILKTKNG